MQTVHTADELSCVFDTQPLGVLSAGLVIAPAA
jgi:hypothetical protein